MRLAILSIDEEIWRLVNAGTESAGTDSAVASEFPYSFACAFAAPEHAARLAQLGIERRDPAEWEELLMPSEFDAVVVGRDENNGQLADQLRKLTQASIPILVSHPIAEMLLGFELQMIRQDTNAVVVPFFAGSDHPVWQKLQEWVQSPNDSPIGRVEQFEWERRLVDRDRANIERVFARDAFLQRSVIGPIRRIGAMLSGDTPADKTDDWSLLSVHMDNDQGVMARWTVQPGGSGVSRLHIVGESGTALLELPDDPSEWKLTTESPDQADVNTGAWRGPLTALDQLQEAIAAEPHDATRTALFDNACRAVELADTLETSCRRGRTIDLHHEELSEEGTFKSIMAAGGCLALMVTFLVTLLAAAISPFGPQAGVAGRTIESAGTVGTHWLWKLLLAALLLFLALQFLRLLFRRPNTTVPTTAQTTEPVGSAES